MGASERYYVTRFEQAGENNRNRYAWVAEKIYSRDYCYPKILDAGCGAGHGTNYLHRQCGGLTHGFDCSAEGIEWARRYYADDGLTFAPYITPRLYTDVVMLEVLEHLPEPLPFLRELRRHTDSHIGRLYLSTPNAHYAECNPVDYPFHVRHYLADEVRELLAESGYTVTLAARQMGAGDGLCEVLEGGDDGLCLIYECKAVADWEDRDG